MLNRQRTSTNSQSVPVNIFQNGAELEIRLKSPQIFEQDGNHRVKAMAVLIFHTLDGKGQCIESQSFPFVAPLCPIATGDLHWYLEQYSAWPSGAFREQATQIETKLADWGQALYQAVTASATTRRPLSAWQRLPADKPRYVTVNVIDESLNIERGASECTAILSELPWELLFDGKNYLFMGKSPAIVRRHGRIGHPQTETQFTLPIRILLVSPRPENDSTPYFDHRRSSLPLLKAVEGLEDLVQLTILTPPTYAELEQTLQKAGQTGEPFTVVHFDGHCRYDETQGDGRFYFETPENDTNPVSMNQLAGILRDFDIPLVFLNTTGGQSQMNLNSLAAVRFLEDGISSVVSLHHDWMSKSIQRFLRVFYEEIIRGASVGKAVLSGRKVLYGDDIRNKIVKSGELKIFEWFIPVLYQGNRDPVLVGELSVRKDEAEQVRKPGKTLGYLPEPPSHGFWGRSRELFGLERLFQKHPYTVVRGNGGSGKTTLAVELARWLSGIGRFDRIAFINLMRSNEVQGILDCLGKQLLPEGEQWSVSLYDDLINASRPVERVLNKHATLIIFDNIESILPKNSQPVSPEIQRIFELFQTLSGADPKTRLLFTSRERLPAPYHEAEREIMLGNLEPMDAIRLINAVLMEQGFTPNPADPGKTMQEIKDLVAAVQCHPRALVLLAPEIHHWGVRATIANLQEIMTGLNRRHPENSENYLFASIELLLRRLPQEMREKISRLGVFQDGADIFLVAHVLGMNPETSEQFVRALMEAGLAEKIGYEYYRFDPTLVKYLFDLMNGPERDEAWALWAEIIEGLVKILYQQIFENSDIAFHLALIELELPNILSWLDWIKDKKPPEEIIDIADNVGSIFSSLGYPQVLMKANRIQEAAEHQLGNQWSHSRYLVASNRIDRLLKQGESQIAYEAAGQLLQSCLSAGTEAYKDAEFDIAIAYAILGKVQRITGSAEAALGPLTEARKQFQVLAASGNLNAEEMYSTTITEIGNCLRDLGRLDKAASIYQESIKLDQRLGNQRGLAVTQIQLGTIRFYQKRYKEALAIFSEALETFTELNEPGTVAVIWHQIGMVHRETGHYDKAEEAYSESLSIECRNKNISGEAGTLNELGNLYDAMGRLEDAVTYYRQAKDIYIKLQDKYNEAHIRSNLADSLINLGQFDEARREIIRAIDCLKPFGHSAEPWKALIILHHLELHTENPEAAQNAREMARQSYLEYRRDGGESQCPSGECCELVEQAIETGNVREAEEALEQFQGTNGEPWVKILIPKLQLILKGEWTPAILEDPNLDYDDAAELQLLLERIGNMNPEQSPEPKKLA